VPTFFEVQEQIARLERRALEKLQEVDEVSETKIDADAVAADRAAGLSVAEIAAKNGVHKSKIYRALNGGDAQKRARPAAAKPNGHAAPTKSQGPDVIMPSDALDELLLSHFNGLPLLEKVRRLLL
jgi:hypothetical protein